MRNGKWTWKSHHFRHIRTRLLVSYALILIVPCMIIGIAFLNTLNHTYIEQKEKETLSNMEVLGENIKFTLSGISDVLENCCSNIDLWHYLYHTYRYPESSISGYYSTVRPLLDNYKKLHPEIKLVKLYITNPQVVTNNQELCPLAENSWESSLLASLEQGSALWTVGWKDASTLVAARSLRLYGKTVGLCCLELDQKRLLNLIDDESSVGSVSLIHGSSAIVLSSAEELTGLTMAQVPMEADHTLALNGTWQKAFWVSFSLNGSAGPWQLMKTIPLEDLYLVARANMSYLILLGSVMVVLMLLLSIVFSVGLTSRLSAIQRVMTEIQPSDFSVRIPVKGYDEVADLATSFNKMMERLEALVEENSSISTQKKEAELAQRMAQLNALQSQINPHFLFNALEAIQYGIRNQPAETECVVQLLARNLRCLASWERETCTLQEELRFVDEYLQIQRFRYGERLHYHMDVDEALLHLEIPNLFLQPLVENAVVHGIAMKSCGGTVSISARRQDERLVFTVHDDGVGMSELEKEELRQRLSHSARAYGPCIGLKNVYERLRLYYNGTASFEWDSQENDHTTIRIIIQEGAAHARFDRG